MINISQSRGDINRTYVMNLEVETEKNNNKNCEIIVIKWFVDVFFSNSFPYLVKRLIFEKLKLSQLHFPMKWTYQKLKTLFYYTSIVKSKSFLFLFIKKTYSLKWFFCCWNWFSWVVIWVFQCILWNDFF